MGKGTTKTSALAQNLAAILTEFETKYPGAVGKAYLTSGNRTIEEQLEIILDPKNKKNYPNIKNRFLSAFKISTLPTRKNLTPAQVKWWHQEIGKQAGIPGGFAHVGGKAQDISVKNLSDNEKQNFAILLNQKGYKILYEHYSSAGTKFGVPLSQANLFHVTKK
jgi:hypothetical protein